MSNERYFFWGRCIGCRSKASLTQALSSQGVVVDERNYSVSLPELECTTLEFECATEEQASVEGTATSREVIMREANLLSSALANADIPHWIEVTTDDQTPIAPMDYQWVDEPDSRSSGVTS